ncbi:MAG: LiaF-related protein [Actinomycetota bacterium]|nr:LiaF-related protein [Actinomycetota bacterium]
MDSPTGTKTTDQEDREQAPATGDGDGREATQEQVVKVPEARQEESARAPDGASQQTATSPSGAASDTQAAVAATAEEAPKEPSKDGHEGPSEGPSERPSSTAPTTRIQRVKKEEPAPKTPRFSPARLVVGAILVLGGIAWLLDVTNSTKVNWGVLLSLALVAVGGGLLLLGLRGGMNRGLMLLGVILAAILTAAAALRIDIAGGIGSQTVHPVSAKALGKTYRMAVGQMTIDLRHVNLGNGSPKLRATVGVGQLVVLVPDGANVRVHARAGAGQVSAFSHTQSGLDVDHTFFHGSGPPKVILGLSVGVGQVTVHKGG